MRHIVALVLSVSNVELDQVEEYAEEWEKEVREHLQGTLLVQGLTVEQARCFDVVGCFVKPSRNE